MSNQKIRENVTKLLIELIEAGTMPWRRPFSLDPNAGLATSLSTGKVYNGINQLLLAASSMRRGFQSKWWGSFNSIRHAGGTVRKGERATWVCLFNPIERTKVDTNGKEKKETFLVYRNFAVFNVEQCHSLDGFLVGAGSEKADLLVDRCAKADRIIEATNAKIVYGTNQPCYSASLDTIWLPHRHRCESPEAFYEIAFHELSHHSHHPSRLNPPQKEKHEAYAFNELVAEISTSYLMTECNLELSAQNHASYLASWLRGLNNDTRFIFEASSLASKTADYILSFSRKDSPAVLTETESIPF